MSNWCQVTADIEEYTDDTKWDHEDEQDDPELDSLAERLPWDEGMTLDQWEEMNDD